VSQDVFHQNHVLVFQRRGHVLDELHFAGALLFGAIAAHGDEVKRGFQLDLPRQVAQEKARALEHAYQNHRLSGEIARDLLADARYALGNLFAIYEYFHIIWHWGRGIVS